MKKLFFGLLLTTIALSSQLEAMWFTNIARSVARNATQRTLSARPTTPAFSRNLLQTRTVQTPRSLPLARINPAQTSVLTRPVEPQKSLVQHPNFRSNWEQAQQKRFYSNIAQKIADSSDQKLSWSKWLFGISAAASAVYYDIFSGDETDKLSRSLRLTHFDLTSQDDVCLVDSVTIKHKLSNINDPKKFEELMRLANDPNNIQKIIDALLIDNTSLLNLYASNYGHILLEKLLEKQDPNFDRELLFIITKDLTTFTSSIHFLDGVFDSMPYYASKFVEIIIQNNKLEIIENLFCYHKSVNLLKAICLQDPKAFEKLMSTLIKNNAFYPMFLRLMNGPLTENKVFLIQEIEKLVASNSNVFNSEENLQMLQLCVKATDTQSSQHLRQRLMEEGLFLNSTIHDYLDNPRLKTICINAVKQEKQLLDNGFYTFIHGQRREYYLPEQLYTFLWSTINSKKYNNFVFAHVKQPQTNPFLKVVKGYSEKNYLTKLRKQGTCEFEDRERLLFLNYAFFGNDSNNGSNTAAYLKNNKNLGSIKLSFAEIFGYFGFQSIYEEYKNKLDKLQEKYKELSPEGTLLLFGIPKDKVNQCVYSAKPVGFKRPIHIEGIGETDDTQLILETLRHHPEKIKNTNRIVFCLIMTENGGGLDPATGIQVHPFIPCDNEEDLQKLEAERKALFEQIAEDIRKQRQATN